MAGNSSGYPLSFELDGNDYMIGSEVGVYMNLYRGALYKKFPSMSRRIATSEERRKIVSMFPKNSFALASSVTLLKAEEVKEILEGYGDRFKKKSMSTLLNQSSIMVESEDTQEINTSDVPPFNPPLLDSNFTPTPPASYSLDKKRIRTFPLFFSQFSENINSSKNSLVPIIIDLNIKKMKLKDYFLWNIEDSSISIETFAELLCDDLGLDSNLFFQPIVSSMKTQISEYQNIIQHSHNISPNQEKRVIIKLDISVGDVRLRDQFEWDISDESNDPEMVAHSIARELGLSSEFVPRISIEIRCQINWYKHFYAICPRKYLPPLKPPFIRSRSDLDFWSPSVTQISSASVPEKNTNKK